ncbi:MAG: lipoate--protein ligase [Bacteroidales bacterium]|nr:lipoate--protein ligase [Bacteroidales bacterium]
MLFVQRPFTDPFFNIAAEEYLLKNLDEDCFMLWINDPAVIIGKHQNTIREVNYPFLYSKGIPVIRRISGGGTVYHDHGNLNFTFISTGQKEKLVDFRKFTDPVIKILNNLGVPAKFEGKNDLRTNGLKISGNAEHVYKNKVLHHGTLLFSTDLEMLNLAIAPVNKNITDKSVQSVRSNVANISDFLPVPMKIQEFLDLIMSGAKEFFSKTKYYELNEVDRTGIEGLVEKKYNTREWNWGYSPPYIFEKTKVIMGNYWKSKISIRKGKIEQIEFRCNNKIVNSFPELKALLIGMPHHPENAEMVLLKFSKKSEIGIGSKEILSLII